MSFIAWFWLSSSSLSRIFFAAGLNSGLNSTTSLYCFYTPNLSPILNSKRAERSYRIRVESARVKSGLSPREIPVFNISTSTYTNSVCLYCYYYYYDSTAVTVVAVVVAARPRIGGGGDRQG